MGVEELKKRFGELIPLLQEINTLNQNIEKRHNQQAILYRNKDQSSVKEQKIGLVVGEVFVDLTVLFIICILMIDIVSISWGDDILIALILWTVIMVACCLILVLTTIKINKITESGLSAGSHCEVCGKKIVVPKVIAAKGHTEVIDEAVSAKCTETGLTEGSHCSICGKVVKEQEEVPATRHTWNEGVVDTLSTCVKEGIHM